jgi:lipopolysaccharide export system permease protein
MIIYRAFTREAIRNTLAITLILGAIVAFIGVTTLLGRAARGDLPEDLVMQMLGLQTLKRLDLLLTLGLYLGVLLTLARWYRDSEMTVLAACGIGLTRLLRPALVLTVAAAVAVSVLSFYFTPWAAGRMERIKAEREQQRQPINVAPGVFNETSGRTRIFYAEHISRDSGALENIFISSLETGNESVVVANAGYPYIEQRTGDRFLALSDGTLYEGTPGEAGYRLARFKELHMRIEPKRVDIPPARHEALPSVQLYNIDHPETNGEWHWRLSKPIMAMVLVLFALVLAHTDPRGGRLFNLFAAILIYFAYSNVLAVGQTLIKKDQIPAPIGLWWAHLTMVLIAFYLLRQRANNRPLFALPRRRRRK